MKFELCGMNVEMTTAYVICGLGSKMEINVLTARIFKASGFKVNVFPLKMDTSEQG